MALPKKLHNKLTNHDIQRQPNEPITTWSQKIRAAGAKRGKKLASQWQASNSWLRLYFLLAGNEGGNGRGNFQPINDVKERLGLPHDASTQTHLSWMDFLTITKYDLISLPARKGGENKSACILTVEKRRKKNTSIKYKIKNSIEILNNVGYLKRQRKVQTDGWSTRNPTELPVNRF